MVTTIPAIERAQRDFPILDTIVAGRRLVYLDSAATSQKPRSVIEAEARYYETSNANVHRGVHRLGDLATEAYESARAQVARFIGAADPRGVVFTRNTTEGINLVARAWGQGLRPGDEVVTTEMEHHSNLIPWQMLAAATGATLRVTPVNPDDGSLDLGALLAALGPRTRLVAVTHCSNVLGTINPVATIAAAAHAVGALVLVDAAQSVPHMPLDVGRLGADFVAFSSHKMCGPMGIGVLWADPARLDALPPFLGGGGMIGEVWNDHATWGEVPARFEAGTPNVGGAVGLAAAIAYLEGLGMDAIREHEVALTRYALDRLAALPGVRTYGPSDPTARGGLVSFNLYDLGRGPGDPIHPHDVGTVLDAAGVAIRAGHHCCHPLMRRLGLAATARASFYLYNTPADVDALVDGLDEARAVLGGR